MTYDKVGALPPPPGVTPNFDRPESIAYRVIFAFVLGPVITIPICLLRLYTKRCILRLVSYVIQTHEGITTIECHSGFYKYILTTIRPGDVAGSIFYHLSALFTKVSLSLFYLRLSPFTSFRIAVYVIMVVSILYSLITAFGFAWVCQPVAKYWDFSITTGSSINLNAFFLATGCINAATDLTLLFLPVFITWNLHLPWPRKISVALLLMTGSFVCVVSLIRVRIIVRGMNSIPTDGTWVMVVNFIWILTEMWLGIICACLPSLYCFFRKYFPAIHGRGGKPGFPAVQDPNSDRIDQNIPGSLPESGYYPGEISNFSLGTIDNTPKDRHVHVTADHVSGVRPAASDKSLLTTISRCND
ncbi:hypothetical protein K469DRAFT_601172 [Zopfia rhizophila CBS 207.26]|uniref:Rhodopsin domain-containing protein n=1 Tax=Zopfia rhizophila CBS 207.26 TaxID=1314779 RepID=A0A6A6DHU7_9PEZI|nr:hypothetical protein K469DRAFT_601172 [Zopfia rhizophila CBS 207.26]